MIVQVEKIVWENFGFQLNQNNKAYFFLYFLCYLNIRTQNVVLWQGIA